jgi:hypothetical protein
VRSKRKNEREKGEEGSGAIVYRTRGNSNYSIDQPREEEIEGRGGGVYSE